MRRSIIFRTALTAIAFTAVVSMLILTAIYSRSLSSRADDSANLDENADLIKTVESFWKFTESGELEKADEFTTDTRQGFTVKVEGAEPTSSWIYGGKLRHIKFAVNRKVSDDHFEVRVRVKDGQYREYWLFHDVVRNSSGAWKISSTSY